MATLVDAAKLVEIMDFLEDLVREDNGISRILQLRYIRLLRHFIGCMCMKFIAFVSLCDLIAAFHLGFSVREPRS